jgi:hypothetical protein
LFLGLLGIFGLLNIFGLLTVKLAGGMDGVVRLLDGGGSVDVWSGLSGACSIEWMRRQHVADLTLSSCSSDTVSLFFSRKPPHWYSTLSAKCFIINAKKKRKIMSGGKLNSF